MLSKTDIFTKNQILDKFIFDNILVKNPTFREQSRCWVEIKILTKNINTVTN